MINKKDKILIISFIVFLSLTISMFWGLKLLQDNGYEIVRNSYKGFEIRKKNNDQDKLKKILEYWEYNKNSSRGESLAILGNLIPEENHNKLPEKSITDKFKNNISILEETK